MSPPWTEWEIQESFMALLSECDTSVRLALFIDGLDEFEQPPTEVVEFIQRTNKRSGVKICVAGRQWTEFNDAFQKNPKLRIQDLNMADTMHITKSRLEENAGFSDLQCSFPRETAHLINEVARKSNGVLLWVSLVVKSLLTALSEGDGLAELQATIDRLPIRLSELYDTIWAGINRRNIAKSAETVSLVKASFAPLDCLTLWLVDEERPPVTDNNRRLNANEVAGIRDLVRRRLDSRTRGIIEVIGGTNHIGFLHRTASDWASKADVWNRISANIQDSFDPYFSLLKAETLAMPLRPSRYRDESPVDTISNCFWYASNVLGKDENRGKLTETLNLFGKNVGKSVLPGKSWDWHAFCLFDDKEPPKNTPGDGFLRLAVRFCILPYLRVTLPLTTRSTVQYPGSKGVRSLLEEAVFGCDLPRPGHIRKFISNEKRLETVRLLLEHGADPTARPKKISLVFIFLILTLFSRWYGAGWVSASIGLVLTSTGGMSRRFRPRRRWAQLGGHYTPAREFGSKKPRR